LATLALLLSGMALAQTRVRTETIRPPAGTAPVEKPTGNVLPPSQQQTATPEIISDIARLPAPVARMRERILAAARSGDLRKVVAVMQSGGTMPIFSNADGNDPLDFWRSSYPDSD